MGVRWHYKKKPSDFLDRKGNELKNRAMPVIAYRLANNALQETIENTPIGVHWVPTGDDSAVPVTSGKLKKSWEKDRVGKWMIRNVYTWKISTNVEYAPHVEYGTAPHIITPKKASRLVWYDMQGKHTAKVVRHPGTKPVYMLTRAVNHTKVMVPWIGGPVLRAWAKDQRHFYRTFVQSTGSNI